jgi:hypothetical protein
MPLTCGATVTALGAASLGNITVNTAVESPRSHVAGLLSAWCRIVITYLYCTIYRGAGWRSVLNQLVT